MEKLKLENEITEEPLTQEQAIDLQVEASNNAEGNLPFINCELCKNRGYIYFKSNYNGLFVLKSKACECKKKRDMLQKAQDNGLGQYIDKRMKDFEAWNETAKTIKAKGIEFCKNHSDDQCWFMIIGQSGCGKTLMGSIICNHLLLNKNKNVLYTTWTDLMTKVKLQNMAQETKSSLNILSAVKEAEVLFLDECLKEYTPTEIRYLSEIINYRYTNNLKTIITSEFMMKDLLQIEESVFGRIFEKCDYGKELIEVKKDMKNNYRLKELTKQ